MEEEHILSATPLVYCNYERFDMDSGTICRGLHFHAEVEAVYTEQGSINCCFKDEEILVPEKSLLLIGGSVIHRLYYAGAAARILYLQIDTLNIMEKLYPNSLSLPFAFDKKQKKYQLISRECPESDLLFMIISELEKESPFFETAVVGGLLQFIALLQRRGIVPDFKSALKAEIYRKIYPALCYANKNYPSAFYLEDMCRTLGIDKYNFCKIFKKATGLTFFSYLTGVRLRSAEKLLSSTDKSITEIALECGFSTSQYFNRVFLKEKGCSPSEFRKLLYEGKK